LHHHAEEGALRNDNDINVVDSATGEVIHHPPDVAEIDELLKALFCFFNDEEATPFIHPLVKASIIHFMVGYIHPFVDGNGRTARALYYWYLLKKDYWLIEYLSVSRLILRAKAQYAKAYQYTEVDEHDLTYFILFSLKITKLAYDELNTYIQRKNEEKEMLAIVADTNGISYRQSVILEWYSHEPTLMITVKEVQRRLGISNQSARTDLQDLVTKGYLQTRPLNKVTNGYTKGANYATLPFGTVNG
jgi:Fic family protein